MNLRFHPAPAGLISCIIFLLYWSLCLPESRRWLDSGSPVSRQRKRILNLNTNNSQKCLALMIFLPIYSCFLFVFVFMMTVWFIPVLRFNGFMWKSGNWITAIAAHYQQHRDDEIFNSFEIFRIMLKYQL